MNTDPRLYIIMRSDIADMNPGKAMAQAAHAQALFDAYDHGFNDCLEQYCEWCGGGEDCLGFGVTTVLTATAWDIDTIVQFVQHSGRVVDPTYPFRNYYGEMFTSRKLTCAWAFPVTDDEVALLKTFPLHP